MLPADRARSKRLVIHPSVTAYYDKWVRRITMPVVAITVVVLAFDVVTDPSARIAIAAAFAALALAGVAFFSRAEIAVQDGALTYRRFLWRRRFPLESVGGLALRRVDLSTNYNARGPNPYGIVYGPDRNALFSFSAALWRDHDLLRLRHAIGGDASGAPMSATELQSEFPGALPGLVVFYETHPLWTLAIATPLMLAAIIAGIVLWEAVKAH